MSKAQQATKEKILTSEEERRVVRTLNASPGKYYVYALCKQDGTPFYIGKGSGSRVIHHREAARLANESIKSDNTLTKKEKRLKIKELDQKLQMILKQGLKPLMVIVKWGLTENEALLCESALINIVEFTNEKTKKRLMNNINGHASAAEKARHVKTKARTLETFLKECAMPERAINDIREKVAFIKINDFYPLCIDRGIANNEKVKECVRGLWTISTKRRNQIGYVFALYQRRVVGIFHIRRVSDEVGAEYRFGLRGFPRFPSKVRAIDRNIARFSTVAEAERELREHDATSLDALHGLLNGKKTPTRTTEDAVLAAMRKRVYFELDDAIPKKLAKFKDCLLKKEGDEKFFAGQRPVLFNF